MRAILRPLLDIPVRQPTTSTMRVRAHRYRQRAADAKDRAGQALEGRTTVALTAQAVNDCRQEPVHDLRPKRLVVEFRTAAGEGARVSIPRSETAVIRHIQERMPYGLFEPDVPRGTSGPPMYFLSGVLQQSPPTSTRGFPRPRPVRNPGGVSFWRITCSGAKGHAIPEQIRELAS
jgi:hypothetical protein